MTNSFIEKMAVLYQQVPSSLLPSIRLAQAILESNWGQSELAREAKNFAGIKADKFWTGDSHVKYSKEEYSGQFRTERFAFRKYPTVEAFIKDHSGFITSSAWRREYYQKVIQATTYQEQAQALTQKYATDSQYGAKLIRLIEQYKLYEYDKKENKTMAKHLVICGHGKNPNGSYDPGAMGSHGTEADWVRRLAHAMAKYNQTDIDYITEQNVYEYRNIATYSGYDTITELHLNAFNGQAKGSEVLIWHEYEPDTLDNKLLSILSNYFVNRGIKKYNLHNMRICAEKGYNYRLVECCFVDNQSDMQVLNANLDAIARQFVEAITGQSTIKDEPKESSKVVEALDKSVPQPQEKVKQLWVHLPKTDPTWSVYHVNGPYSVAYAIGQLAPQTYGGLDYHIECWLVQGQVAQITTQTYGKVGIYIAPGTGAQWYEKEA